MTDADRCSPWRAAAVVVVVVLSLIIISTIGRRIVRRQGFQP
jgi:hypothetical protein